MNVCLSKVRLLAITCLLFIHPVCHAAITLPSVPDTAAPAEAAPSFKDALSTKHLSFFKRIQLAKRAYKYQRMNSGTNNNWGLAAVICSGIGLLAMFGLFVAMISLWTASITGGLAVLLALWAGCSIAGIITGAIGIKRDRRRAMAITGMVVGIVCTCILALGLLILVLATG